MSMSSDRGNVWKFVSGILGSLLLGSIIVIASDHTALAVVQAHQATQDETLEKLTAHEGQILELLNRHDEQIKSIKSGR